MGAASRVSESSVDTPALARKCTSLGLEMLWGKKIYWPCCTCVSLRRCYLCCQWKMTNYSCLDFSWFLPDTWVCCRPITQWLLAFSWLYLRHTERYIAKEIKLVLHFDFMFNPGHVIFSLWCCLPTWNMGPKSPSTSALETMAFLRDLIKKKVFVRCSCYMFAITVYCDKSQNALMCSKTGLGCCVQKSPGCKEIILE